MNPALTQFLIDIVRGHRKAEFLRAPDDVIAASRLSPDLQDAVRLQDVAALHRAGAHPMALMYFARSIGWDNARYYGCIESAPVFNATASDAALRSSARGPS